MREKLFQWKLNRIQKRGERYKREHELKEAYAQYLPEKKKKKVSNIMLIIIVVAIVGYVAADFILQYKAGIEISPTITTCWFVFWTSEVLALMGIRISKVKNNYDSTPFEMPDIVPDEPEDDEACG